MALGSETTVTINVATFLDMQHSSNNLTTRSVVRHAKALE